VLAGVSRSSVFLLAGGFADFLQGTAPCYLGWATRNSGDALLYCLTGDEVGVLLRENPACPPFLCQRHGERQAINLKLCVIKYKSP